MTEEIVNPLSHALTMPWRAMMARPRLVICIFVGLAIGLLLPASLSPVTRLLLAWNGLAISYVALVSQMMRGATHTNIRRRAKLQDEGQWTILFLALIAALVSLGAIVLQLGAVKDLHGTDKALHIGLASLTIVMSFAFTHFMFALHYAHEYYAEWNKYASKIATERGGLHFPGTVDPRYIDFVYFSFVIGVACQTADVETTSRAMRVIVLIHGIVAFFFNTTVLALTINIAAGLI